MRILSQTCMVLITWSCPVSGDFASQDKGGNIVDTYSEGGVTATLVASPASGVLLPSTKVSSGIR